MFYSECEESDRQRFKSGRNKEKIKIIFAALIKKQQVLLNLETHKNKFNDSTRSFLSSGLIENKRSIPAGVMTGKYDIEEKGGNGCFQHDFPL